MSFSIADHVGDTHKNAESVMAPKSSPVSNKPPTTAPCVKTTKSSVGSNDNCYSKRSGREVRKPLRYRE